MNELKAVGKRVARIDASQMVTGQALFADDFAVSGMLRGKVLRSPHPHAEIVAIDVSQAMSMRGVMAVVTGKDLPEADDTSRPVFAHARVRFAGEALAAVAAVDLATAEEALSRIQVEYRLLPPVLDLLEAMESDAQLIHANGAESNVYQHVRQEHGDVEAGFAQADRVFEHRFETKAVHQAYLEPHSALAQVDSSGRLSIWTSTQSQFEIRAVVARKLEVPMTQVRIIPTEIGGGFGGKNNTTIEPICALLAMKTKQPVKITMSREEEFTATNPADAGWIELKTGVRKDGTITARQAKIVMDSGAYASSSVGSTAARVVGPYRVANVEINGYAVFTNKTDPGALRAPGAPQAVFAGESQLDIIAEEMGIDPFDLRMANLLETGDISPSGQPMPPIAFKETLQALADSVQWKTRGKAANKGLGLACGEWTPASAASSAYASVNEDGSVKILSGSINLTGSSTSLAQIAAEELGVAVDKVSVVTGNTDLVPYVAGNWGSRTTYGMGAAVLKAVSDLKSRLYKLAGPELEANPEELECREDHIVVKGDRKRRIPLSVVAAMSHSDSAGPLSGSGALSSLAGTPVLAAQCAEVTVDSQTGRITVDRFTAAQEVGFAINPLSVEGQIQGGVAQGLGWALMEQIVYQDGQVVNPGFLDYKVPTACDVPAIEVVMVEAPSRDGPYGAKGVGEPCIIPTAPSIANAICDAVKARINDLPITPEKVLRALRGIDSC